MNTKNCILAILACLTIHKLHAHQLTYQQIGSLALQAEDILKITANTSNKTEKKPKNIKERDLTLKQMSTFEKKELVFNLFNKSQSCLLQDSVINLDGIAELNLIAGDPLTKKTNLLHRIKRTKTVFGDAALTYMLSHPTNNQTLLTNRQDAVRELISNPHLLSQCDILLNTIKNNESSLLLFWEKEDESRKKILEQVYFGKTFSGYNSNPYALELSRALKYARKSLSYMHPLTILQAGLALSSNIVSAAQEGKTLISKEIIKNTGFSIWHINKQAVLDHKSLLSLDKEYTKYQDTIKNSESSGQEIPDFVKTKKFFYGSKLIPMIAIDLWWGWNAYHATQDLSFYNRVVAMIHKQMNGVAHVYQSIKGLNDLVSHHQSLLKGLQAYPALSTISEQPGTISSQLQAACTLLNSSTLTSPQSNVSLVGRALAAYHLMPEVKEQFVSALEAIGELDALVSVAKLVIEHGNGQTPYCFVEFIDQETPEVDCTQFWNPLLEKPTTDSVQIGASYNRPNILLTGPHGCGKSTAMKAITYNIILAQTFGIAAAHQARITIFDNILTYLNIKENVDQQRSTFMAEALRIDYISNALMSSNPQERSFVVMDEALKGTMEEEGAQRLYEFGKKIFNLPRNLCIMATHFEKVSDLEQDLAGRVTNYHVGLEEPETGHFVRTYKLIPGQNQWWFEDAHKRGRFIDWLTNSSK